MTRMREETRQVVAIIKHIIVAILLVGSMMLCASANTYWPFLLLATIILITEWIPCGQED